MSPWKGICIIVSGKQRIPMVEDPASTVPWAPLYFAQCAPLWSNWNWKVDFLTLEVEDGQVWDPPRVIPTPGPDTLLVFYTQHQNTLQWTMPHSPRFSICISREVLRKSKHGRKTSNSCSPTTGTCHKYNQQEFSQSLCMDSSWLFSPGLFSY